MQKRARRRLASLTLIDIAAGAALSAIPLAAAQAQPSPAFNWSGYYAGAHVGYRWGDATFTGLPNTVQSPTSSGAADLATVPGLTHGFNPDSGIGGGHFGYNWQFNQNWLFGFEGDWSWGRSKANALVQTTGTDTAGDGFTFRRNAELTLTWQATLRARAGWVVQSSLWYVTGGVAFAEARWSDFGQLIGDNPGEGRSALAAATKTLTGYVVGAGFEQMLAPNFTWRVEYLYEDFGNWTVPQAFGSTGTIDVAVHKVRIGLTFKP